MDRSPYLAQLLAAQPVEQATFEGPDLASMAQAAKTRQAWEAANPGGSYAKHQMGELMAGVKAAPGKIAKAPGAAFGALGQMPEAAFGLLGQAPHAAAGLLGLGMKKFL